MRKFTVHRAKTELSKLLKLAADGEEVVILNRETPLVRLVLIAPEKKQLGTFEGEGSVSDDFDAPLDAFKDYR